MSIRIAQSGPMSVGVVPILASQSPATGSEQQRKPVE
jgi:hypothetical protein